MSSIYSNRLDKRNFEVFFQQNKSNFPEKGEITGDQFNYEEIDQGMPIRGNFIASKNNKKNIIDTINFDFDIFDKDKLTDFNINYFDPMANNGNIAHLDNFRETNAIVTNDIDRLSNIIDEYGYFLFNNVQKYLLKNHYLLTSFYLNNILTSLFIASKNKTNIELKNYLNISDKVKCMSDINLFHIELEKLTYLEIFNFLIVPYEFKLNKTFLNYLPNIKIINYENKYADLNIQCSKINKYISTSHNLNFDNTLKSYHLKENSIIALISGKIQPVWKNNFDDIIIDTFYSFHKRNQNFLISKNKQYNYFRHDNLELLEIPTYDNKMSFGIIMSDKDYYPKLNPELINFMISNLAPTQFKYLSIPQIKDNLKLRYTNILKESGLTRIFESMDIPELIVNNNIYLNDIVQNIYLIIDKNNKPTHNQNKENKNNLVKQINTPFIYYFRLNTLNTILCLGQYC